MKRKMIFFLSFLIISIITAMAMNAAEEFDRALDQHLREVEQKRREKALPLDEYVEAKQKGPKLDIIRIYEANGIKPKMEDDSSDAKVEAKKEAHDLLDIGLKCYKVRSLDNTVLAHTKAQKEQVIANFKAMQQHKVDQYNANIKKKGILKKKLVEEPKKTVFQKYPKLERTLQYLIGLRNSAS